MIIGNDSVIATVKAAQPGDASVLVSLEALENLPEVYDAQIVKVPFVPPIDDKKPGDFSPVGGDKYMPTTDLMNKIAEARGISGMDMALVEPIYEEIDWNRMTLNFKDPPKLAKYLVGYRCTKQGKVLVEDGTERISDPCTVIYNAWERVCELWSKEEQYTDNYTKCTTSTNGTKTYPEYKGTTAYCKYDSMAKRRFCFDAEIKFAERKADSKARNVVIRTLCGMPTGYDAKQLQKGYFVFGKIVRSAWAIKSEHAARLQAMSHGVGDNTASKMLFGPTPTATPTGPGSVQPEPDYTVSDDIPPATDTSSMADQALDAQKPITGEWMKNTFEKYVKGDLIPEKEKTTVNNLITWLSTQQNPEKWEAAWQKALAELDTVESAIPKEMRATR